MDPTNGELLALATPVGVAKTSFTEVNDMLLAVFMFGMAVGVEGGEAHASRLGEVAEGIIRSDERTSAELDKFLDGIAVLTIANMLSRD